MLNSKLLKVAYSFTGMLLLHHDAFAFSLPIQPIRSYECKECSSLSRDDLSTSWSIENKPLYEGIIHKQISRKFSLKSSLKELKAAGTSFTTQAPGAIIRMVFSKKKNKNQSDFFIQIPNGKRFDLKQASSLFTDEEEMKITGLDDDAFTLQLKPELGFGEFKLKAKEKTSSLAKDTNDDQVNIFVYDKDSPHYLVVGTDRAQYKYGEKLKVIVQMRDKQTLYPIDTINATFKPNEGAAIPLKLIQSPNNTYEATVDLNILQVNERGEAGYVSVDVEARINNQDIKREGHSAWSYIIPSATLSKIKAINTFTFQTELNVATSSRYALEGILYGSDSKDKLHPIQIAQTATWLSPGSQSMKLQFDPNLNKLYKAPYYLGNLRLIDYYQLKPVYEYKGTIPLSQLNSD